VRLVPRKGATKRQGTERSRSAARARKTKHSAGFYRESAASVGSALDRSLKGYSTPRLTLQASLAASTRQMPSTVGVFGSCVSMREEPVGSKSMCHDSRHQEAVQPRAYRRFRIAFCPGDPALVITALPIATCPHYGVTGRVIGFTLIVNVPVGQCTTNLFPSLATPSEESSPLVTQMSAR